ncbi:TIGR02679 family protein [Actinomadura sp. HBU206391]|uniref:TIGR02679 family protein n=1 Tax=Actinomadura sp. HBU206391 TaxID=2731692 RepID=UPI00164F2488|nr:TIGR02679 family protein [Actinomadura sp. HBU206391]MBC6460191.1 TIGR02679 family protein [Actinomadura sp. HBU206391]
MSVPDRLRATELEPVWAALHHRLSSGRPVSRVTVDGLDAAQQAALADLLGLDRYPGESTVLSLARLDAVLNEITGLNARAVTEAIMGPLDDRAGARAVREHERAELWSWLGRHPAVTAEPSLQAWVADVRRAGVVGGSARATQELLEQALAVLAALPGAGGPLPALAADAVGDPHALDDGQRLSGLVLRALATLYGVPVPDGAQSRRALWERAGIACDELSTLVLAAGLRPWGGGALGETLRIWASAGQTAAITLAQLRDAPGLPIRGGNIWVVENPSILALAVQRFGADCPPMVCTSGWPNSAGVLLLRTLRRSGAIPRYHGDLDGEGIRIAAYTLAKCDAVPWRMDRADYLAALETLPADRIGVRLPPGRITEAPWDGDLAEALRTHAVAVPEELVVGTLLADLEREA